MCPGLLISHAFTLKSFKKTPIKDCASEKQFQVKLCFSGYAVGITTQYDGITLNIIQYNTVW